MKKQYSQFSIWELFLILVLPFIVYAALVCILKSTSFQNVSSLWIISGLVSEAVGFVFVVKKFNFYSLLIGLLYFPVLYFFLHWFGFAVAGLVFGDFL